MVRLEKLLTFAMVSMAVGACSRAPDIARADASEGDDAGDADPLGFGDGGISDAPAVQSQPPDGSAPPVVACDLDAGADVVVCPLPHSVCASSQWLQYFDTTGCVNGFCAYQSKFLACYSYCLDGGCISYQGTAPAPP